MEFDWDQGNIEHIARHNILPHEAEEVFANHALGLDFQVRSEERRFRVVGETNSGRLLTVAATFRRTGLRVITAWDATKKAGTRYLDYRRRRRRR